MAKLLLVLALTLQSDTRILLRVARIDKTSIWVEPFTAPVLELRQTEGLPLGQDDRVLDCAWAYTRTERADHADKLIELRCGKGIEARAFVLQGIDLGGAR